MKKERESGLELLRILCMLLIIAHHYSVHGGFEAADIAAAGGRGMFVQMLAMFGRPVCSVFVLVSGYFLIGHGGERRMRRLVPLLAEQLFYSAAILAVVCVFHLYAVSPFDVVHALVPVIWGNWYVVCYVVLYTLLPFLDRLLCSLEKRTYQRLIAVILVFWSVIPTFAQDSIEYGLVDLFLVMYVIGGYIGLYMRQAKYPNGWNLAVMLGSMALMLGSTAGINLLGRSMHSEQIISMATWFCQYYSLPGVVFAVSAVLYFSRLTFSNRWIDLAAGSMIGVYLIHDDGLLRGLVWRELSPNAAHLGDVYLHAPVKILAVFLICLGIDLLRRATVEKVFLRWFDKACAAWDKKHTPSGRKN